MLNFATIFEVISKCNKQPELTIFLGTKNETSLFSQVVQSEHSQQMG